jgi:dTDP-4-dehydrorhamnose reductase
LETEWFTLRILITGASGLYGSKLAKISLSQGLEVYSTDVQELSVYGNFLKLDITDKPSVEDAFSKVKPNVVVHAATLTDVDKCETNKDLAWKINVEGTRNIIEAAKKQDTFVIYISTDYVFNGEKGFYKETDKPDPIQYYGYTKLKAEEVVQDALSEYFIGRPSVIYGSTPAAGKVNFVLWVIDKLRKGERIKIVDDQYNTPTLNTNIAEMTLEVAKRKLTGVFHLCGATRIDRLSFAKSIAKTFDLDASLIDSAKSSDFSWPAKRPADSSLDTSKAQKTLTAKPLELDKALEQLKQELKG